MIEHTEGVINNGQSRETRRRQTKQKHITICVGDHGHYSQANTNDVNKT